MEKSKAALMVIIVALLVVAGSWVVFDLGDPVQPTHSLDGEDPDRDLLTTETERELGTDPRRKTLVLHIMYGSQINGELDMPRLKSIFNNLKVANPGTPGIEVVVREQQQLNQEIQISEDNFNSTAQELYQKDRVQTCVDRVVVVGVVSSLTRIGTVKGIAQSPEYVAAVSPYQRNVERATAHELLHTVIGRLPKSDQTVGRAHTKRGLLSHGEELTETLSNPTRKKLNETGFEFTPHHHHGQCD